MSIDYAVGQIKRYTEEKKIIWYMQYDGTLASSYKVTENEFSLTLRKNHEQRVVLCIELKNIMRTDILQEGVVIWRDSPLDRFRKNIGLRTQTPQSPDLKLVYKMEELYNIASEGAIKPEQTREILLKLISGI